MSSRLTALAAILAVLAAGPGRAGDLAAGWDWLAATNEIQTEGAVWNDRLGDGKDRWKTGGLTQSYVFPERIFSDRPWFGDRTAALELNARGLVITPDNTAATEANGDDRPYAQYAGVGVHLRTIARPHRLRNGAELQNERRLGLEVGWQGEPLPLFDIRNGVHDMAGTGGNTASLPNSIDGEWLVNLEGRQTWRLHWQTPGRDFEVAPFVQGSAGMREVSLRVGADVITGSALEGRSWGNDLATGALLAGASMPREGFHWTTFAGADIGYVAFDAFLDGGFAADGPSVPRRPLVGRLRAGFLLEYDNLGLGFSLNWLSKEFRGQSDGQLIGAIQVKYRF